MKISKIPVLCLLLIFAGTVSLFALDIDGKPPTFAGRDAIGIAVADVLNDKLSNAAKNGIFDSAMEEIRDQVGSIDTKPDKFIQAWGNSSVYASQGATQRGYAGYKLFAVTMGPTVGFQLPSSPFTIANELENIDKKINDEKDLQLGVNPQVFSAQVAINTSKFMLKDLYLGFRFGYMKLDSIYEDLSFSTMNFGLVANYQIVPQKKLVKGLFLWRGVNVGTGLIYQGTKIGYKYKLDTIEESDTISENIGIGQLDAGLNLKMDPKVILDIDIRTFTIPVEVTTSVRLLWFLNLPLGLGFDFGFGKSDMSIGMSSDINVNVNANVGGTDIMNNIYQDKPGKLSVKAGGDMAPQVFNLKLMTGLGISIGPVVLDIPISWYFLDHGFSVGVTFGAVW